MGVGALQVNGSDAIASSGELPLVGRGRELSELMAALDEARAGRGGLVLITGDPGIGKTRLARTLGDQARDAGAVVALARGWDGGGAPSYWPWLQVVRAVAAERDDERLAADLGAGARWVAQIAPEVRERVDLPASDEAAAESEQARFALFDAIAMFLRRVAADAPVVVLIDDLHTADLPSLLLLAFLARAIGDSPVLVVTTHHDAGPPRGPEPPGCWGARPPPPPPRRAGRRSTVSSASSAASGATCTSAAWTPPTCAASSPTAPAPSRPTTSSTASPRSPRATRIATDVRDPRARSYIPLHRARRALMEGHAAEAERLIEAGVKLAWSLQDSTVPILAGAQLFSLRRAQGRLGELQDAVRQFADSLPAMPAWRCALAVLYLDDGREREARRELEHLAGRGFEDFPRDNVWMVSMSLLAELCEGLHDGERAAAVEKLLEPFDTRNVVSPEGIFGGPVTRYLALCAAAREDWDTARGYMARAREAAERLSLGPTPALLDLD